MGIAGRTFTSMASSGALLAGLLTGVALVAAPAPVAVAADDGETGCDEAYDSAVVGNTPIMFQRIINHIPQGVTVSTLKAGTPGRASEVLTRPKPVWLGQKTPFMDGRNTLDWKKWNQRHSNEGWPADHWWDSSYARHHVGCATNYPFVIGPGEDKPRLIDYDGRLFGRNDSWRGKAKWWGVPKRYEQDFVGGFSTWTCRGDVEVDDAANPTRWKTDSVYWAKVSQGSGFFGDNDTDRTNRDAGRAPACENSAFEDMEVKPNFRQTFYGSLPDDVRSSNDCQVTSTNNIVGCWQRIYAGPWNRSWRTETNVFAASMVANFESVAEMEVPAAYRGFGDPKKVKLSWAISDVFIDGAWPDGFNPKEARVPTKAGEVSKYTVPGATPGEQNRAFKFGGWIDTTPGKKQMKLRLTGVTDGTWEWPTCQDGDACTVGEPMARPVVNIVFSYDLDNFDRLGKISSDDGLWRTSKYYTRTAPIIIGMVPTLYPVGDNVRDNEQFRPKNDDKGRPLPMEIGEVKFMPIKNQFWTTTDLGFQQSSPTVEKEGAGTVGANVRWDIQLTGVITPIR